MNPPTAFTKPTFSIHAARNRLVVSVDARPGASLDTYIEDCARANHLSLRGFGDSIGLLDDRHRFPPMWGAAVTDRHHRILADELGIDAYAMTLHRFDGNAVDLDGLDVDRPTSMRTVMRRRWLTIAGSRYCPECLNEQRPWQIEWKLPWSFACTRHRVWLHDTCPECQRRPRTYGNKPVSQPAFTSTIPHATRCPNRQRTGTTSSGRAATPCRTDLARTTATRCPARVVRTQRTIAHWTRQTHTTLLGEQRTTSDAFHVLQSVCVWLDHTSTHRNRRPWISPPASAHDLGVRATNALDALAIDRIDDAAEQLAFPLSSLLTSTPSARTALRERVARNELSDELADLVARRFERPATRQKRRATQLLLSLDGTTIEDLIANVDRNLNYAVLRKLTGVDNATHILRDAVIIDAAVGAGARTKAHAADLAQLSAGAVRRHGYIRRLVNQADNSETWLNNVNDAARPSPIDEATS